MKKWLLDLFFPPKCVFCGKLLRLQENHICENCRYTLPETDQRRPIRLTKGCVAPLYYRDNVREAILRYKFGNRPFYAAVFGPMIATKVRDCPAELVTWVPVSRIRKFSRGYDQAQLLAEATAGQLGLPCVQTMKKRHTPRQSRMRDAAARRANVVGAFSTLPGVDVRGKNILLIDDICTTGSTMAEAALTLRTAGAAEIYGAVLAMAEERKNSR